VEKEGGKSEKDGRFIRKHGGRGIGRGRKGIVFGGRKRGKRLGNWRGGGGNSSENRELKKTQGCRIGKWEAHKNIDRKRNHSFRMKWEGLKGKGVGLTEGKLERGWDLAKRHKERGGLIGGRRLAPTERSEDGIGGMGGGPTQKENEKKAELGIRKETQEKRTEN